MEIHSAAWNEWVESNGKPGKEYRIQPPLPKKMKKEKKYSKGEEGGGGFPSHLGRDVIAVDSGEIPGKLKQADKNSE